MTVPEEFPMHRLAILPVFVALASPLSAQTHDLSELMRIPTASSLQFDSAYRVDNDMRRTIKDVFVDVTYYGAFAEHPSGAYGYSTEANSVAAAEASAIRFCGDVSDHDGRCQIVARLMPKGVDANNFPPISPNIVDGIIEVYGLNEAGYAAVAASGDGAWGSSLNGRTEAEAITIALDSCEEWRLSGGETPLEGFPCAIVAILHSSEPLPPRQ